MKASNCRVLPLPTAQFEVIDTSFCWRSSGERETFRLEACLTVDTRSNDLAAKVIRQYWHWLASGRLQVEPFFQSVHVLTDGRHVVRDEFGLSVVEILFMK